MKWQGNRRSDNVQDVRGASGRGSGFRLGGGRGIGLGTVAIALVAGWIFGINPLTVLGLLSGGGAPVATQSAPGTAPPENDQTAQFVATVLADTEDVWRQQFQQMGATYRDPTLTLFRGAVPTACGTGQSAMGPFYCPGDHKIYIDLSFFDTMRTRLGAPGDFAQAYVIAHEVAHHVQNLLGITGKVDSLRGRISQAEQNAMSVRVELQADCLAGVWAHHAHKARQVIEEGDIEEALNAASQIGDDNLQKQSRGTIVPESFTHGTSAQRVGWFKRGIQSGDAQQCDTFSVKQL